MVKFFIYRKGSFSNSQFILTQIKLLKSDLLKLERGAAMNSLDFFSASQLT